MMRIIAAALVGGILLFFWGFLAWVVLGLHNNTIGAFPMEDAMRSSLRTSMPESGVYWLPGHPDITGVEMDVFTAKYKEGPVGYMVYDADGADPNDPKMMAKGFVINVVSCLIIAVLVAFAGAKSFGSRLVFVILIGLLIANASDVVNWNFMHHPLDYTLMMVVDRVIGFALAGVAIAAIVRPGSGMR